MADQQGQEKTEAPSDRRRDEARDEGQVAFSKEVPSAALLGGVTLVLLATSPMILDAIRELFQTYLGNLVLSEDLSITSLNRLFRSVASTMIPALIPIGIVVIIVGIFASVLQVGIKVTPKAIMPKFSKLSPLNGIKRLFSLQALADFLKSMFKLVVIGYIGIVTFQDEITNLTGLSVSTKDQIIQYNFSAIANITGKIVLALIVLAVFDFFYQRWDLEQKLKMTKQEVKEENKHTEGDPQLKARIRQVQREMSRARMMQEVPKADAIVVNPTHYAVAIRYDREIMEAPQITAKGIDFIALRMKTIARENNVPVIERPPLARDLYANVEIGQAIPERFYKAVAEILAYVYRLKGGRR